MNWIDFAKKYRIENPLEFFGDLERVSRKADKPALPQAPCYEKLPPDFGPLKNLLPVAKRELEAISKRYKYEPVVLTRFVQKLEEYLAAISS